LKVWWSYRLTIEEIELLLEAGYGHYRVWNCLMVLLGLRHGRLEAILLLRTVATSGG
jgi:hypothetical protein